MWLRMICVYLQFAGSYVSQEEASDTIPEAQCLLTLCAMSLVFQTLCELVHKETAHVFSEILIEHTPAHHLNRHPQPQKKP